MRKCCNLLKPIEALKPKEIEQVEIQIKYEGYIKKALEKVEKLKRMEAKRTPENIDYAAINGLATEAKQKLQKNPTRNHRPSEPYQRSKPS